MIIAASKIISMVGRLITVKDYEACAYLTDKAQTSNYRNTSKKDLNAYVTCDYGIMTT